MLELGSLTHSLAAHCSLRSRAPQRPFSRTLAHSLTPKLIRTKGLSRNWMCQFHIVSTHCAVLALALTLRQAHTPIHLLAHTRANTCFYIPSPMPQQPGRGVLVLNWIKKITFTFFLYQIYPNFDPIPTPTDAYEYIRIPVMISWWLNLRVYQQMIKKKV